MQVGRRGLSPFIRVLFHNSAYSPSIIQSMPEEYDDWGHPIPRWQPQDQSISRVFRNYLNLAIRRYKTLVATILFGACLLLYWKTPGEPKAPPVDWRRFAYVQSVSK